MSAPIAYHNGKFLPLAEVAIPLDDAGVVWGATVVDRLRTFGGRLFALDAHLRRFRQGCELARVPQPVANAQLARISEQLVRENRQGNEVSAVWIATPGPFGDLNDPRGPTLIVYTTPLDPRHFERQARDGVYLVTVPSTLAVDPRVKHRSRLPWWIAMQQARGREAHAEPLLVEAGSDLVLETPAANVLAVLDGAVVSPPRERILGGVTLGVVEDLCRHLGLSFVERPIAVDDLKRASEVLLANTTYCLAGVSRIGEWAVPFPGPILDRLLDAWSQWVGVDIRRQMAGRS
jgi:branched-subunit amino acid aminotransferase/4-amino-4-deoxychorismate lyase